jgi:hypothetical protein
VKVEITKDIQATLISVKIQYNADEFGVAMELILEDLRRHPERAHQSVIVASTGWDEPGFDTYEKVKQDQECQKMYALDIRKILSLGVPIVCAAGNYAERPGRGNIDSLPMLFSDETTPIINVGAADYNGQRAPFSQGGSQVTIYAPGVDIEVPFKIDHQTKTVPGTSVGKYFGSLPFLLKSQNTNKLKSY